jgi:hypothetical protein
MTITIIGLASMDAPNQPAFPPVDCIQQLHQLLHLPGQAWQERADGGHHILGHMLVFQGHRERSHNHYITFFVIGKLGPDTSAEVSFQRDTSLM